MSLNKEIELKQNLVDTYISVDYLNSVFQLWQTHFTKKTKK